MARRILLAALGVVALAAVPAPAKEGSRFHAPVSSAGGVVATESPAAARAGRAVLEAGGNAIDAAVATAFALGVARPQSCGLGGGGFLVYRSASGRTRALDFRETAPAAFTPTTLAGPGLHKQFTGHLTVGVPGFVAGMDAAVARYGTRPLAELIEPAEVLAGEGFAVPTSFIGALRGRPTGNTLSNAERLALFPAADAQYLHPGGRTPAAGDVLVQPDLAASLRRIQRGGRDAFYTGTIARRIVRDMQAPRTSGDPGLLTLADLAAYRATWRTPLAGTYRGRQVVAMPPPTSGGVAVLEMLNVLEGFDLAGLGRSSAQEVHLVAEAQRLAWADRNAYVADPDVVPQRTGTLTSKAYAERRRAEIDPFATRSYSPGAPDPGGTTTHVSVVDRRGAAVALTCTIEQELGSGVIAPGTGFLLNNELTDFGDPGTANEAGPGKRPRSSMSPTIVVDGGRPVLVTGGAGGSRIIMGVLHSILNTVDFGDTLAQAVDAERFDDQGGAKLEVEDTRFDPAVLADLTARGYALDRKGEYFALPRLQLAGIDPATRRPTAVSDSRSDRGSLGAR